MSRLLAFFLGFLLVLFALLADARALIKAGPGVAGRGLNVVLGPAGSTLPPLDGLASPTGAYSLRKLITAYAGSAIRIRRTTGGESDIGFLGFVPGLGAPLDVAAATSFCAATTCFVTIWYDQSGNARDIVNVTPANQPELVFNCAPNGLPCVQTTTATQSLLATVALMLVTGITSMSVVARRVNTVGPSNCILVRPSGGNRIVSATAVNLWQLQVAGVSIHNAIAADNTWHSLLGIVASAASSIVRIDGTETSNASGGTNAAAGTPGFAGIAANTCQWTELAAWDNIVLNATQRPFLVNNQRSFWGF